MIFETRRLDTNDFRGVFSIRDYPELCEDIAHFCRASFSSNGNNFPSPPVEGHDI